MGMVQGRCIIGAVARHSHYLASLLQHLHQSLLIGGTGAAHHLQCSRTLHGLFVGQRRKLSAGDGVQRRHIRARRCDGILLHVAGDTYLAGYLHGRGRCVARHYFHIDACLQTVLHGLRHFLAHRVADGHHRLETAVAGKGQRAHGLPLIGHQPLIHGVPLLTAGCLTHA